MPPEIWQPHLREPWQTWAPTWDPTQLPPFPVRRLFTPEREQACVVEARLGVSDLEGAHAWFDERYERRGNGWVEVVDCAGAPWLRAALWTTTGRYDSVHVETVSRESYARLLEELTHALPSLKPRQPRIVEAHGFAPSPFARDRSAQAKAARVNRPDPGAQEAITDLIEREEQRWLRTPNPLLDGRTPIDAIRDPDAACGVYELIEWIERTHYGGMADRNAVVTSFNPHRLRAALGIGRDWEGGLGRW